LYFPELKQQKGMTGFVLLSMADLHLVDVPAYPKSMVCTSTRQSTTKVTKAQQNPITDNTLLSDTVEFAVRNGTKEVETLDHLFWVAALKA
jgi:hypothetical protein